jgi:hypothetical protein
VVKHMKLAKVGWVGSSSVVERGIKVIAPGPQFNNPARHEKAEDHTCISSLEDTVHWTLSYRS